jgi:large subunit ribosomal protein L5
MGDSKMATMVEELYKKDVKDKLMKEFGYKSVMQVPRIQKITLNMGLGEASTDKKVMAAALEELTKISGQKPVATKSKKSIAGFKIRDGWPIGAKVTMRNTKMFEFWDRLVSVSIPRIRDFRGLSEKSFDGRGNYTFGVKEQAIFPEIEFDQVDAVRGMDITINTSANTDEEARALLRHLGFPFKGKGGSNGQKK